MAWSTHPTIVTGQTWTATDHNTYVKGNLDTLFPYTSGLQVAYSTSTTTLSKATSTALSVLRTNAAGTAIEFGSMPIVYKRQGYSTTDWSSTSSSTTVNNYTETGNIYIQSGVQYFSIIIFPVPYSKPPIVFCKKLTDNGEVEVDQIGNNITSTGFIAFSTNDFSCFVWTAIGEI